MSTKASIPPKDDAKRPDRAQSPYFLASEDVRKGFGHMLGALWLRETDARKARVA